MAKKITFYRNFPMKVEAELRDGPQFVSAYRLTQKLTVRELVSLSLINDVIDPNGDPGNKSSSAMENIKYVISMIVSEHTGALFKYKYLHFFRALLRTLCQIDFGHASQGL
jgi:hypothetical protein